MIKKLLPGAALAIVLSVVTTVGTQGPVPTELFFSEYIEGTSNNKALEIYNGTGAPVTLTGQYSVRMLFNGSSSGGLTINLTGTVAPGDVFVLAQVSANTAILAQADQTSAATWYNGDDAVVLARNGVAIDVIGQIGVYPGPEWGTGLTSTADNTLRRHAAICTGDAIGSDAFNPSAQWDGFATNTADGLGSHPGACGVVTDAAPIVTMTVPANGATEVPVSQNIAVTFSEPVNANSATFTLSCSASGSVAFTASGGPTTVALDPVGDLPLGETCTLTVVAANVFDQDTIDPPDTMVADVTAVFTTTVPDPCTLPFTRIYTIQGSGATAAITGTVTTQGIVVGDYEGASPALRGFFIQDPAGDGDPATSDGIFVFDGSNANRVNLGDLVRVGGAVSEFQGQTQITLNTATFRTCGTGTITPAEVTLPFATADAAERVEGMLVRLPQTLQVTEHFQLGRFGQVVLSSGGRLPQPTSVATPGADALAVQAANDLNRIIVDDATQNQNPDPILFARSGLPLTAANTLRGGDTATGIVGVMTYTWGGNAASPNAYRVRPIGALNGQVRFEPANPRPGSVPDVGGTLRVAGMNLLNYFNTFDGASSSPPYACNYGVDGALTDCRGADDAVEFGRQWPKTVAAVLKTGADVVGLVEIENDGYGPDSAIADLVARLNAATAPGTYAYVDADEETGELNALGTDAIKVGLIYKPAVVMPVGLTAALNTASFVTGGDGEPRNRPALAQAFQTPSGGRFVAAINHLKSKGSTCDAPDAGDGQGDCNDVRANAAGELAAWLAADPTGSGDARVLVLGDLNAYAQEDPVTALRGSGFTNLIADRNGPSSYSYAFDGQWGYLDHALASADLGAQVTGVAEYHINADEPSVLDYNDDFKSAGQIASLYAPDEFRVADHDPIVVGLALENALAGSVSGGGWLAMPAALHSRGWSGKVTFAVAVQHRSAATVPTGSVVFRIEQGQVFKSTSMQWLTVSGGQAVLQGDGVMGGEGGYAFRVTAVDGQGAPDRLRVRIWSTVTGEVVLDSGPVADIQGGSIVVRPQ